MSGYFTKFARKLMKNDNDEESKEEDKNDNPVTYKLNVNNFFNQTEDYVPVKKPETGGETRSEKDYLLLFDEPIIDLEKVKNMAWHGIPRAFRAKTWKLLLKYLPQNKSNQEASLKRKREEYYEFVVRHLENVEERHLEDSEKKIRKIIWSDVLRT
jgi:hypothetical protein